MVRGLEWNPARQRAGTAALLHFHQQLVLQCQNSTTPHFADDTKSYKEVASIPQHEEVQDDLYELDSWSETWQIGFNRVKCKTMHLGYNNNKYDEYLMYDGTNKLSLSETEVEKDLGVLIDRQLNFHEHTSSAVKKANSFLGTIKRTFSCMDAVMIKKLFASLVRPWLEYGNCVRSSRFKTDIKKLEQVQRRATKLIPELKDKPYQERLRALKLPSLYHRQKRGDMIQTFKIIKGIDRIQQTSFSHFLRQLKS